MWPLVIASVLALGAALERLIMLRGALRGTEELIEQASDMVRSGRIDEARGMALRHDGPVGRVITSGLDAFGGSVDSCERAMVERALIEREGLTRRVIILDTVITIAPLLGLLGTVTGMIRAFEVVGSKNQIGAPVAITGGVAEALIATATGLGIAIFSLVLYNYINEKVRQAVSLMEIAGTRIVNIRASSGEGVSGEARAISA